MTPPHPEDFPMSAVTEPLHTTTIGEGHSTVVWCHGIFGQAKNFTRVAKALVARDPRRWRCVLVDLPNHGHSPWTEDLAYPRMATAVAAQIERISPGRPVHLLGHSMGGKVAMATTLTHPDLVSSLVVVDIAPVRVDLTARFVPMVEAMRNLDLDHLENRRQAEGTLTGAVPDPAVRQFLLQNLRHDVHATGGPRWYWQMNLEVMADHLGEVGDWPDLAVPAWDGPVLWMGAQDSDYVRGEYTEAMTALFPRVKRVTVKNSGHWVHSDQPEVFTQVLASFLDLAEAETGAR